MGIELISRQTIYNDTAALVEAGNGALTEIQFARNTATGAIGYSIDAGVTWTWLPTGSGAASLDDLTDVIITTPANGQQLQYNGSAWVNTTPTNSGKYRQYLYTVVSGNPTFLTDGDGNILTVALDME